MKNGETQSLWKRSTRQFFQQPLRDVLACLEHTVQVRSAWRALAPLSLAMIVTWFVYVPIHELLHCLGCVVTGGTVSTLELSAHYGAAFLKNFFPFIVSGSDYAGRLSGFDTGGSDLCYLATDFGPFVLTVLIGVPLIKMCSTRRRPILFGIAIVVGLAPFYNIPGDYFEMASTLVTRAATILSGGGHPPVFEGIRSDDIFLLIGNLITKPSELGLTGPGEIALGTVLIAISFVLDVLLAFATYWMGHFVAKPLVRRSATRR